MFGQHLGAQVDGLGPAVIDHLRARATIDRDNHRRLARRRWPVDRSMQLDAIARLKPMQLGWPKIELDRARRMDHVPGFAIRAANGNAGRMLATIPDIDEAGEIRRDLGSMDAGFVREALRFAAFGLVLGLPISILLTRVMSSFLFGVVSLNLGILAGLAALLLVVAVTAGYVPARRAMKVDPLVALRYE